ncbi:NAD(P)-dependent alcohol dehydrogenase [Paludibaculum fermentans]|uniref:NAD(P)-dependent alcohol dehydrogenase n=1 Tax=Paludibaculum fermentans TaxID=1473598 RepID=UPI003EC046E2
MKAAVYSRYGPPDVIHIEEVDRPIPRDNEVLVHIHAATVSAADWRMRKADPFLIRFMNGLRRPKKTIILGMEFSGTVAAIGRAVTLFAPGDKVFGGTGFQFGAHAEYVCLPEGGTLAAKPENITMEEAAGVLFGGFSALHFLRKGNIQAGQNVLIYGASGSVGTFAVQLAVHFGARVTGVCSSANMELVRSLGAAHVLDYTREDFSSAGPVYDMVFDAVGYSGFERSLRALKRGGYYVRVGGSGKLLAMLRGAFQSMWTSITGAAKVVGGVAAGSREDQLFLKGLIESGKLRTVIDRCYPLAEIAEAHRYVEAGHKKGQVIILIEPAILPSYVAAFRENTC